MLSIFSYDSGPSVSLPWKSVCSSPLPFFNCVVCLPGVQSCVFFIYFGDQALDWGILGKYVFPYCWFSLYFNAVFFSPAEAFLFWWGPICLFFPLWPSDFLKHRQIRWCFIYHFLLWWMWTFGCWWPCLLKRLKISTVCGSLRKGTADRESLINQKAQESKVWGENFLQ